MTDEPGVTPTPVNPPAGRVLPKHPTLIAQERRETEEKLQGNATPPAPVKKRGWFRGVWEGLKQNLQAFNEKLWSGWRILLALFIISILLVVVIWLVAVFLQWNSKKETASTAAAPTATAPPLAVTPTPPASATLLQQPVAQVSCLRPEFQELLNVVQLQAGQSLGCGIREGVPVFWITGQR